MSQSALRLEGVACARGGRLLLTGVNLSLAPGEGALLLGPNGTGKSSLLRTIAGLLPAFAGTIQRTGAIALADENPALDRQATLTRALGFWARIDGATPDAVAAALAATGLDHLADIPVRMLSTGQRRRATLARVAASGAPIWLLDEPANGLDTDSIALLGTLVERHLAGGGILVAASHQPLPFAVRHTLDLSAHMPAGEPA